MHYDFYLAHFAFVFGCISYELNLFSVEFIGCLCVRESHQFCPAVGGLEPQPGDLWHHQRDRWRVRLHHLQLLQRCLPLSVVWMFVLFFRPKDAVKALKKRIVGNKNFREVMLALTVSVCYITSSTGPHVCLLHHKMAAVLCFRFLRRVWRTAASVSMCMSALESLWRASWSERYCPKTTHPWSFMTESWASSRWGESHCRCC